MFGREMENDDVGIAGRRRHVLKESFRTLMPPAAKADDEKWFGELRHHDRDLHRLRPRRSDRRDCGDRRRLPSRVRLRRIERTPRARAPPIPTGRAVLDGVNVASLALMAVVSWQFGAAALVDPLTVGLALVSLAALVYWRINSAWLIGAGAAIGWCALMSS